MFWVVDSYQHILANRSHVRYEFTNTKTLVKKLARIEASSICHQLSANMFADCFCALEITRPFTRRYKDVRFTTLEKLVFLGNVLQPVVGIWQLELFLRVD